MLEDRTVKRYSLSKQVADQLEEMIESGEYEVGGKIHTETELMKVFDVSRNTLREAIQSLASAGILEVRQGDGTYVRNNSRFNANMKREFSKSSDEDVFEVRNALELTIARLAAKRRDEEDLISMHTALIHRQGQLQTIKENTKADLDFHMAIAKASHNKILLDLYSSITSYMETMISNKLANPNMSSEEIDELHETLYNSIRDKKGQVAVDTVHAILAIN